MSVSETPTVSPENSQPGSTWQPKPLPQMSTLRAALVSEWTKLRSVRSTVWALVMTAGFTIGLGALFCYAYINRPNRRRDAVQAIRDALRFDPTAQALGGVVLAMLAIGVLGVLVMSSEHSTGMVRTSMAAVPKRRLLLLAKTIVLGVVSLAVSVPACFIAFFLGQAVLSGKNLDTDIGATNVLRAVLGAGLFLTMIALLGLAIGTIVRRTPGALATLFGIVLIFPLLAQALPEPWDEDVGKFAPLFAGQVMYSVRVDNDLLSPTGGLMVMLGWLALAFVTATVLISRRDA